jgi:hypothetical protein
MNAVSLLRDSQEGIKSKIKKISIKQRGRHFFISNRF